MVTRVEKSVSEELVDFRRKEQMHRLRKFLLGVFTLGERKVKGIEQS
jgi:hypothetical protein